jgi:hypothetical protein
MLKKLPAALEATTIRNSDRNGQRREKAWARRAHGLAGPGGLESCCGDTRDGMLVGSTPPVRPGGVLSLACAPPYITADGPPGNTGPPSG